VAFTVHHLAAAFKLIFIKQSELDVSETTFFPLGRVKLNIFLSKLFI
jgi:hypothetical protein